MKEKIKKLDRRINSKDKLEKSDIKICESSFEKLSKDKHDFELMNELNSLFSTFKEKKLNSEFAQEIDKESFYNLGETLLSMEDDLISDIVKKYLDIFRFPGLLKRIYKEKRWAELIHRLIMKSNFTFDELFEQRKFYYQDKTLFKLIKGDNIEDITWNNTFDKVDEYKKNLFALTKIECPSDCKIAFLTTNSLDMVYFDLACLTSGIVNIMIPANSVPQHIEYVLNQTKAKLAIVSSEKQLAKIKSVKTECKHLEKVILINGNSAEDWVLSLEDFKNIKPADNENLSDFSKNINHDSLATIMYTSGTTGVPKGIMFSHMNIVYKRFCRAMALPEIGDKDRFLAYLPMFHTFGRYFEMTGSIFWGAEYIFMENPSIETMIKNMQNTKPTIFISIPKKWIQLYETVNENVDIEFASDKEIKKVIRKLTGGELRFGLSAAGYLSPDVFEFFQRYNIELMSGFGMTEATGGITMTPPNEYVPNSLGKELPGIKIKVAEDGELLIKGSYVMLGYYGQPYEETFDEEGWFATGDIMKQYDNGFIEIVDRKKEIYKNIKGETIAPQRIENLFYDFNYIKQVFLVGDHRPFNTVLIYPDYEADNKFFEKLNVNQKHEYISSAIASINKFIAPFERIVDFRITERGFQAEKGELTPKNTYKRSTIENNFENIIEEMYRKNFATVVINDLSIKIPNWFLREIGCISSDIKEEQKGIEIPKLNKKLQISYNKKNSVVAIGSYKYKITTGSMDLQNVLTNPIYWLGNYELVEFTGDSIIQWQRHRGIDDSISVHDNSLNQELELETIYQKFERLFLAKEKSLSGLHLAIVLLQSKENRYIDNVAKYFEMLMTDKDLPTFTLSTEIIKRAWMTTGIKNRRKLLISAIPAFDTFGMKSFLKSFLKYNPTILDESLIKKIISFRYKIDVVGEIADLLDHYTKIPNSTFEKFENQYNSLFNFLAYFGIAHPTSYERIRQIYAKYQLMSDYEKINEAAQKFRTQLRKGFRSWLGENQKVTVDLETGDEYTWEDVIIADERVSEDNKERIVKAVSETQIIREALFLFTRNKLIRLNDILPGGIWVSPYREYEDKVCFRLSIQTRMHGSFDVVLNLNKNQPQKQVLEEINWLIQAGSRHFVSELVEDFGGYWDEYDLWSSKYVSGDTLSRFLSRESKLSEESRKDRLIHLWPFFIWNASAAYFNFWRLTGYKKKLLNSTAENFIIPPHDYQFGTKVVSFSEREDFKSLPNLFYHFYINFVEKTEKEYPFIKQEAIWNYIFSGLINVEGEEHGVQILQQFKYELEKTEYFPDKEIISGKLKLFFDKLETVGFMPKPLYFAIKRFIRWKELNIKASKEAQAQMLNELYETYFLKQLEYKFPETRTRFYLETVFSDSDIELRHILEDIIQKQHKKLIDEESTIELITDIKTEISLSAKEEYFLMRLNYPYLKPEDEAQLIKSDEKGGQIANLVVQHNDFEGHVFYIRHPINPKEISRLQELFIEENLMVNFNTDHKFLVALTERKFIIGGLFYKETDERTLHMDKIVVASPYRRKGISNIIMNDFFNRAKNENKKYITTGFFRPEYFYRFGFKIERRYSGLVKKLS